MVCDVWLTDRPGTKLTGKVVGFDEYMNIVLDEVEEVRKDDIKETLGRIMLKGDNITLIRPLR